jgi:general stress protein 26
VLRLEGLNMDNEIRTKFWEELSDSPFMMVRLASGNSTGQPMTAQLDKEARHAVWFFMNQDNTLAPGGPAHADIATKGHKVFAALSGNLVEESDRAVFDKLWTDKVAAWFDNANPPLLMRFDIADSEVWQVDMTIAGLFHLYTGSPIKPEEVGHHATGRV